MSYENLDTQIALIEDEIDEIRNQFERARDDADAKSRRDVISATWPLRAKLAEMKRKNTELAAENNRLRKENAELKTRPPF